MTTAATGKDTGMTDTSPQLPVVAGVDGSEPSLAGVDLAAEEASLRPVPLELVYAFAPPWLAPPVAPGAEPAYDEVRRHAQRVLHEAGARVRDAHPDLPVITRLRDGPPAGVLIDASGQATLLVVGHRGRGGFTGLLTGSVGIQLASHAACPVVITRGQVARDAPVVVGVDGSDGARRAAEFARDTAAAYGVPLVVLFAWPAETGWAPGVIAAGQPPPEPPDLAARTVRELARTRPSVPMRPEIRTDRPAHRALVEESEGARLVVVGARGRGGFRGLLLGSVSQALIHHARCPVAVVPPGAGRDHGR